MSLSVWSLADMRFAVTRYRTIVADPPWRYQKQNDMGIRTAEAYYGTMTTDEIAALPVESIAAEVAHLYMWVTNAILLEQRPTIMGTVTAAAIARAWGFEPRTVITWVKTTNGGELHRGGMGWYFRGATEHVIFATRGQAPIPSALREPNVLMAPRGNGGHSSKPLSLLELAERVSPAPRIELFARESRLGWDRWGNEVQSSVDLETPEERRTRQLWYQDAKP